jgi:hypothetical protein
MRKPVLLASVGLFTVGGITTAFACNCHLGRGVRFDRTSRSPRPASVLIYISRNTGKSTLGSKELQSVLKQAGHKLEMVDDARMLDRDVDSGKFDIVLAEYPDAVAFATRMKEASANAVIVPVMPKAQKTEYSAAAKQFTYVVKSMGDPYEYLKRIDRAMKSLSDARNAKFKLLDTSMNMKYSSKQ